MTAETVNFFYVDVLPLEERLDHLQKKSKESKASAKDCKVELETLQGLLDDPPKPPPLPFQLSSGEYDPPANSQKKHRLPPPPSLPYPSQIPRQQWQKAMRTFRVVYPRVYIRERPHLYAKKLGVVRRDEFVYVERETEHWVKLRDRTGWILKAQSKFGQLLLPLKQQTYENKYAAARKVKLQANGTPLPSAPFSLPQKAGGSSKVSKKLQQEESAVVLPKRIVVEKGRQLKGMPAKKRDNLGDDDKKQATLLDKYTPPPPPPRGWDVFFDALSRRNYYRRIDDNTVFWELPDGGRGAGL